MKKYSLKVVWCLAIIGVSFFAYQTNVVSACRQRDFGHGSIVCVCDEHHCDIDIPQDVSKVDKMSAKSYSSSKHGDRFVKKTLHFSKQKTQGSHTIEMSIDRKGRYQKIIGFGGAFTDVSGEVLTRLPKNIQKRLIEDYFGDNGIDYTLARIPIGGTDFSRRAYSYDDSHPNDESLKEFSLQNEDHHYKIPFMQIAKKVAGNRNVRFIGSPWSAPAWMKTNNKLNNGGLLKGHPGEKYYKLFAKYFIKFLQAYEKNHLPMWGITIENEPGAGFISNYKWNSMAFNGTLQRDFIKHDLGPELHHHGYTKDKLKILICDDQLMNLKSYAEPIYGDSEAQKYVSGMAFHWYFNAQSNRNDLDELYHKHSGQFILATEACNGIGDKIPLGSWDHFVSYATDIIQDLNHYAAGWIDWNIALNEKGGHDMSWSGSSCASPIVVSDSGKEYYKNPMYYAMGHFSKFLPPNSVRISHNPSTLSEGNVEYATFERPDQAIVALLLNNNNHQITVQIHDPNNGYLHLTMDPNSMQSVIWH